MIWGKEMKLQAQKSERAHRKAPRYAKNYAGKNQWRTAREIIRLHGKTGIYAGFTLALRKFFVLPHDLHD